MVSWSWWRGGCGGVVGVVVDVDVVVKAAAGDENSFFSFLEPRVRRCYFQEWAILRLSNRSRSRWSSRSRSRRGNSNSNFIHYALISSVS